MNKPFLVVASAFTIGFALGNLTALHWSFFPEMEAPHVEGSTSGVENALSDVEPKALPPVTNDQRGEKESQSVSSHIDARDTNREAIDKLYPGAPPLDPPHVADPYFYGPDLTDPAAVHARNLAIEDHVQSLRKAGVPEAVVKATIAEIERDYERARLENMELKSRR